MKCVLVLAHLMSKEGYLSSESIERSEKAINLFVKHDLDF